MIERPMIERDVVVRVHEGLHARPAALFAKLAKVFAHLPVRMSDGQDG